ncbi:hypothetical protein JZ751_012576 [Albula glossodonta]|uniref:Tetratricopeptide repeat protein 39B n=1 Tax=Albula glossodonta TaxID=121402 RepID=A0A8T2NX66_9TELE|nr:hypothetical protein JZ751_012576 [Albula glossodonta]
MSLIENGADTMDAENSFEDAVDHILMEPQMDLQSALEECITSLNLFLNNKFSEALAILEPRAKTSMYHAMGHSSILVMQAGMTFDPQDIQIAMDSLKDALQTCQRFRKNNGFFETLTSLIYKQTDNLTEEEMHAEICFAECLLQKAALTFLEDESMIGFLKSGIKIRTSFQIFKECYLMAKTAQHLPGNSDTFKHFVGGVNMGIGSFNLMLSLLPAKVLRLLEFIGFSGNRDLGLSQLREGAASHTLRAILSALTLLMYHTYVTVILGTAESNLDEAEALLEPYIEKFPNGSLIIFYVARIAVLKGYFEKQQWLEAYRYADLLCKESKWSQAIYVFQKAAILSMLAEEEVKKTGENVVELFRQVDSLMLKFAGKSIPTEKFVVRKARRYNSSTPVPLVVPALEMMYVWNDPSEYHSDDKGLVQLLKGLCLKHLGRLTQAELCFTQVISSEKRIKFDHYLVPFSMYELGLIYKLQGDTSKAISVIENAKMNYKNYSMESRLHFRIHAALHSLKESESIITP